MVDVTVYKTLRRPKGSQDEDDYVPWFNLAYGTEINDALAVVVSIHAPPSCRVFSYVMTVLRE